MNQMNHAFYQTMIAELGIEEDPRHVEAFMLMFEPAIASLSNDEFTTLAKQCAAHAAADPARADKLARGDVPTTEGVCTSRNSRRGGWRPDRPPILQEPMSCQQTRVGR
ncbi:MAG: hypothetical protein RIC56_03760 [Pseudomonadales bacterium]